MVSENGGKSKAMLPPPPPPVQIRPVTTKNRKSLINQEIYRRDFVHRYQCPFCQYFSCESCNVHLHIQLYHPTAKLNRQFYIFVIGKPDVVRQYKYYKLARSPIWWNISLTCPGIFITLANY